MSWIETFFKRFDFEGAVQKKKNLNTECVQVLLVAGVRNIFYLKYYLGFFILKRIYKGYSVNSVFLKCGRVSSLYTINKVCGFLHSVKICCDAICFTRGHTIPQVYLNSPAFPV